MFMVDDDDNECGLREEEGDVPVIVFSAGLFLLLFLLLLDGTTESDFALLHKKLVITSNINTVIRCMVMSCMVDAYFVCQSLFLHQNIIFLLLID
jgi:hypothetical protein